MVVMSGQAQSWLDYDQALSPWAWLRTTNPAALTTYAPDDSTLRLLADARVGITTGQGHLAPLSVAPDSWQVDAAVRSIARMSHRVVLCGGMDYTNLWGHDAAGSVWLVPDDMPFDITETTDSTRGNLSIEHYGINGEVGVLVGSGVSLGARFAYATASGAKRKDPRHTGTRMQMDVSVGALWRSGNVSLGANYLLRRTTEALQFSTYGRTDRVYDYLIDQGAFFGRDEQSDSKGYVGTDYEKPWLDMRHGVALQLGYDHGSCSAGIEGQWLHRHGHYGLESPSLLDFNRHHGDEWHLTAWLQHATVSDLYRLTAHWNRQDINDDERTYRIVTQDGITQVNYYDDWRLGERRVDDFTIVADAQWGIDRALATWQAQASVSHKRRTLTASLYPYYRQQLARLTDVTLTGRRNWLTRNDHTWSLTLTAGWAGGGGTPCHDGAYTDTQDAAPVSDHTLLLMRQYEWFTADRLHMGITLRWSMPVGKFRPYAEAAWRYCHALDIDYLQDSHRHTATLAVGCQF